MGSDHVRGYDELQYGALPQRLRWAADLGRLTCIHRRAWCYARSADEGCNVPVHHRPAQAELHLGEGWPYPRLPACCAELLRGSAHGTDVCPPILAALPLIGSAPDRSTRAVTTLSEWLAPEPYS